MDLKPELMRASRVMCQEKLKKKFKKLVSDKNLVFLRKNRRVFGGVFIELYRSIELLYQLEFLNG